MRPEFPHNIVVSGLARRDQGVRHFVGVEHVAAEFGHHGSDSAFPTADAARQADAKHQRPEAGLAAVAPAVCARLSRAALMVLLMSMAIVSGPTPPGTGVMAPAISAASG